MLVSWKVVCWIRRVILRRENLKKAVLRTCFLIRSLDPRMSKNEYAEVAGIQCQCRFCERIIEGDRAFSQLSLL